MSNTGENNVGNVQQISFTDCNKTSASEKYYIILFKQVKILIKDKTECLLSLCINVNNEWHCEQEHFNSLTNLTCAGRHVMADSHKFEVVVCSVLHNSVQ